MSPKKLAVALLAVRFAIIFSKRTTSKGVHAKGTHKMLRVPLLVQGIHTAAGNGLSTSRAQAASLLVIMNLTVGLATIFIKRAPSK